MLTKKQLLLKSIRELLSLNVPIDEILSNLKEVGVTEQQAKQLIEEAKNPKAAEKQPVQPVEFDKPKPPEKAVKKPLPEQKEKVIEQERQEVTEQLAAVEPEDQSEAIAEALSLKKKYASKAIKATPKKAPPVAKAAAAQPAAGPAANLVADINISKLWEKGILGTVNQRLSEMKELKKDIDAKLDQKVESASKRELDKIKVLFDSQRALMVSKVDAELEVKAKDFAQMIEAKLREMKGISQGIDEQLETLKAREEKSRAAAQALELRLKDLEKTKSELLSSFNSELIESKTQAKQSLDEMNQRLASMDARINKTLQLENQITEGLVKGAEQRVDQMLEQQKAEFAKKSFEPLEEFKNLKQVFEAEQKQKLAEIAEQFHTQMYQLDTKTEQRLAKLDELQKAITTEFKPGQFRHQMKELEEFKMQFVAAIQENAKRFNAGIKRINTQSETIERQFILRAEKIDKKIAELDTFEKNFAKELGVSLEKLTKKKGRK
jgi:hypothetical protein